MHIYLRYVLIGLLLLAIAGGAALGFLAHSSGYFADDAIFSTEAGAIDGYDPVAYLRSGQASLGSPEITAEHAGAVWHFSSVENRDYFLAEPEKYLPQYGGYCAYAVSEGYTAYSDPTAWVVSDGRLYLNYNHEVKAEWNKDRDSRILMADGHWPQMKTDLD